METHVFLYYYSVTMPTFLHFNLFILTTCVVHISILYPFQFFIPTFPFLVSFFSNLHSCMWKRLIHQGMLVQLKTALSFLERNKQHFLD